MIIIRKHQDVTLFIEKDICMRADGFCALEKQARIYVDFVYLYCFNDFGRLTSNSELFLLQTQTSFLGVKKDII